MVIIVKQTHGFGELVMMVCLMVTIVKQTHGFGEVVIRIRSMLTIVKQMLGFGEVVIYKIKKVSALVSALKIKK